MKIIMYVIINISYVLKECIYLIPSNIFFKFFYEEPFFVYHNFTTSCKYP